MIANDIHNDPKTQVDWIINANENIKDDHVSKLKNIEDKNDYCRLMIFNYIFFVFTFEIYFAYLYILTGSTD